MKGYFKQIIPTLADLQGNNISEFLQDTWFQKQTIYLFKESLALVKMGKVNMCKLTILLEESRRELNFDKRLRTKLLEI